MIYGVDDLPLAVSTADIRDAPRAMAATRMLPARKSIDSVSTYYASKVTFHAERTDAARVLLVFSCILHGHIWDTSVILRDASPLAHVLIAGVVAAECPSAEAFAEIFRLAGEQLAAHIPSARTTETPVYIQLMMCTPVEIKMTEGSLISQRLPLFMAHFLWHRRLNSLGQKGSAAR